MGDSKKESDQPCAVIRNFTFNIRTCMGNACSAHCVPKNDRGETVTLDCVDVQAQRRERKLRVNKGLILKDEHCPQM